MKKHLICMAAVVSIMFASVTSYAATYETSSDPKTDNSVSTDKAERMKTVIIYKGDNNVTPANDNIVYVDQADNTFNAQTKFLLKSNAADGIYTVLLGGNERKSDVFYIGMSETPGDTEMTGVGVEPYVKDEKQLYKAGYKCDASGTINSLIIKVTRDGKDVYMGCNLGTFISTKGDATIGIQINGLPREDYIKGVWVSPRTIAENNGELSKAPASKEQ